MTPSGAYVADPQSHQEVGENQGAPSGRQSGGATLVVDANLVVEVADCVDSVSVLEGVAVLLAMLVVAPLPLDAVMLSDASTRDSPAPATLAAGVAKYEHAPAQKIPSSHQAVTVNEARGMEFNTSEAGFQAQAAAELVDEDTEEEVLVEKEVVEEDTTEGVEADVDG